VSLLAIETSTEYCSVAVLHGAIVRARTEHAGQTHSRRLMPLIQAVLAEAGIGLQDCAAVAFGAGPGSFTGLRIACSVAQGLAWGRDLPVVPVGTLVALAEAVRETVELAPGTHVLAALDARMGELYWAVYEWDGIDWIERAAPGLDVPGAVAVRLAAQGLLDIAVGCGNGFDVHAAALGGLVGRVAAPRLPDARQVVALAARQFARAGGQPARDAAPLYVRDHVALTTDERRAVQQAKAHGAAAA